MQRPGEYWNAQSYRYCDDYRATSHLKRSTTGTLDLAICDGIWNGTKKKIRAPDTMTPSYNFQTERGMNIIPPPPTTGFPKPCNSTFCVWSIAPPQPQQCRPAAPTQPHDMLLLRPSFFNSAPETATSCHDDILSSTRPLHATTARTPGRR